ncbi:glycosyltransferase [Parabacteroides massiliensis]|uniref:glycosyltransferase n=1 Tax=Parabacteroides massiliensis TaxID=1750560 RepID=UPI0009D68AE5|nr:glycosyltransferase [Parabacteroides massiliensis]
MKNERRVKTLLVLNPFPREPLPTGRILPGNWSVSTNRELLPKATAVLFHLPTADGCWADYLSYKIKGQVWVAWSRESGQNFQWLDELDFASLFELKMGYRKTDDILYPYYKYEYKDLLSRSRGEENKEGDVCVLISSLLDKSGRFEYLSELMRYLPIDSYGKWMQNRLLEEDTGRNSKLNLYRKYKFVIAFENAIEEDYVTEKFYDPLLAGSVPVYLGAPNIRNFQPGEHCFVDVNVFDSPKELAGFLKDCCRDDCLYEQFHSWRNVPLSPGFMKMAGEQKSDPFLRVCRQIDDYLATNSLAPFPAIESWKGNTERNIVVSVVMPVYNQEKYVQDAIESILNQTFQDFELIVVNDGSDDNSESKILSCRDERIVYVRNEENQGNYPARNIGIAKAKGRYVAVMDADDLAFPTRLEQQFTYLENHRDLCVVGSGFTFSDTLRKCRHPLGDEEIRLALLDRNSFMHASLMIRMEALRELGGYNEAYRYASDYDLVCRLVLYGKVENLPDILMIYRCHPD